MENLFLIWHYSVMTINLRLEQTTKEQFDMVDQTCKEA